MQVLLKILILSLALSCFNLSFAKENSDVDDLEKCRVEEKSLNEKINKKKATYKSARRSMECYLEIGNSTKALDMYQSLVSYFEEKNKLKPELMVRIYGAQLIEAYYQEGLFDESYRYFNNFKPEILCNSSYIKVIKRLISDDFKHFEPERFKKVDEYSKTLMMCFVKNEQEVNAKMTCALSSSCEQIINARDSFGSTELIRLSFENKPKQIEILINIGANINAKNNKGETALMAASYMGNTHIAKILLENGADPLLKETENDYSAATYAAQEGYIEVLDLLDQYISDDIFNKVKIEVLYMTMSNISLMKETISLMKETISLKKENIKNIGINLKLDKIIMSFGKGSVEDAEVKAYEEIKAYEEEIKAKAEEIKAKEENLQNHIDIYNKLKKHYCIDLELKKLESCNYLG